jgi:hypothetical protein
VIAAPAVEGLVAGADELERRTEIVGPQVDDSETGHIDTSRRTSDGHARPRRSCPAFQVSGRSLSDALERSLTTYREVVMTAIST